MRILQFMELDDDNQAITTQMEDIPTGVVMNGFSSGVSSVLLGNSYRTGFGTKYLDVNTSLLDTVVSYNSLNAAINGDAYRRGVCETLKMSPGKEQMLDRVYTASKLGYLYKTESSNLNYFKSDPKCKRFNDYPL